MSEMELHAEKCKSHQIRLARAVLVVWSPLRKFRERQIREPAEPARDSVELVPDAEQRLWRQAKAAKYQAD